MCTGEPSVAPILVSQHHHKVRGWRQTQLVSDEQPARTRALTMSHSGSGDSCSGTGGHMGGSGSGGSSTGAKSSSVIPAKQRASTAVLACRVVFVLCALTSSDAQVIDYTLSETMEVYSTDAVPSSGIAGMTTYRMMFTLERSMRSVYAMAGSPEQPLSAPPAYQTAPPFGVDIGGVSPAFLGFMPDAAYDSWLTVGPTEGESPGAISASPGLDIGGSWSLTSALGPFDNAAIFWMNPSDGPGGPDPVVMGQLTVPSDSSPRATALLQGARSDGDDAWQAAVTWEPERRAPVPEPAPPAPPDEPGASGGGQWQECDIPDINECISNPCENGATCLDSHNSTDIPHHAYRCACQAGFANGTCSTPWVSGIVLYMGLCDADDGNCNLELDECMSRPCEGGFTCLDLSTDPIAPTPDAYACEAVNLDPCTSNPCLNGATCSAASLSGVGRRQWLLQCSEGVPTLEFSAPDVHNELTVYDGGSVHAPRLLTCGGHCVNPDGSGCNDPCSAAQGTGSQVSLAYSSRSEAATGGELYVSYTCETPPGGRGSGRRVQNAEEASDIWMETTPIEQSGRRVQDSDDWMEGKVSPSVCATSYVVMSVQDAASPYAGMQTLQLSIELNEMQGTVYTIFGNPDGPLTLPPAFQASPPMGVDVGGVNPSYFSVSLEAELDSWLTLGVTDGSLGDQITSVGIDFHRWNADNGLTVIDGAVFLMNPDAAPGGSVAVAQITVPTDTVPTIVVSAQGRLANPPDGASDEMVNWQCSGATWMFTDVVTLIDGGVADLTTTNSSVPQDAYVCTCAPGFADGTCEYDFIPQYTEQCSVPFGGNCYEDVDECISTPCANSAVCLDSTSDATIPPDEYQCGCPPGLAGGYCSPGYLPSYEDECHQSGGNCEIDIDECSSDPCQNGALCTDSTETRRIPLDRYSCSCTAGYANGVCAFIFEEWLSNYTNSTGLCSVVTGGNCDMDLDECISTPCQNGGTCTESSDDPSVPANSYHCECTDDWSTIAETECTDCHIGKHFTSGERYVGGCKDCRPGTYSDVPGTVFCTDCAAGKHVSTSGADSSDLCLDCTVGQFSLQGAANCTRCPAGQFQGSEGMHSCIQCQPGSVTDTLERDGATACTACSAGQFSTVTTVACETCLPGSVTNTLARVGATTCSACSAGQFSAVSTHACAICSPGSITDTLARVGATTCTECRPGKYSEISVSPCVQCRAGSYSPSGSTECTACGRPRCRFYPDESDVAYDCSAAQWVASTDQSTCTDCHAGSEPSSDRSYCEHCLPGTASEDGIQCLMCNDTRVNRNQSSISNSAQTACVPCGPGDGANAYASECLPCAAGTFAPCTASGCGICAVPLIVTPDRTACVPAYRCPAAQSCVSPCLTSQDCAPCPTGSVSAGGEACTPCADSGPGWVANDKQTACISCPPGTMPSEDRSICVSCVGDYISMLGSECQRCATTQVANAMHTKCLNCGYGEVADNGVCKCGENYYNSSDAVIECGETCNIDKGSTPPNRALVQLGQAACSRCPPCVRCPVGSGLAATPLIQPGFGLPKSYQGRSIAELLYDDEVMVIAGDVYERPIISIYKCLVDDFCSGDHFTVDRRRVTRDNVATVLEKPGDISEDAEWQRQLVSLAAGARIRVESENDFSESTLGSALKDLNTEQLAVLMYAYYVSITEPQQTLSSVDLEAVHLELAATWREKDPAPIFDGLRATYTELRDTVVIPDAAIATVRTNSTSDFDTKYSCSTGHEHTSVLCALCEPGYAGGSTHTCKHCTSGTTGIRVGAFMLLLAFGWVLITWFPAWVLRRARASMRSNLHESSSESELVVVGATNVQGGSAFTYSKIIVSHFQVLLQFSIIMHVRFPKGFQDILDYMSVFKGDLLNYLNLKCAVQLNLYSGFGFTMGFPPFAFVVCLLWNFAQDSYRARKPRIGVSEDDDEPAESDVTRRNGVLNQMFLVLFAIYPFLGAKICHVFKCVGLNPSGTTNDIEEWQQYNMEVDCSDTAYKSLQSLAVIMFIVYPIGVPAVTMYVYWKNYSRLHGLQSAPVARDWAIREGYTEKLPWWHGDRDTFYFMVRDYRPKFFWWEILEFMRKFALTGLLIFAEQGSASQIVFGITLAFGFGLLNAIVRPYVDARTNTFRILSDCSLFITLLIVLVLHFKDTLVTGCEWLTEVKLQWILISANFVFLFLAANQEMLRRLFMLYQQSQLVGILYDPDHKLDGGDGQCATLYHGQYRATTNVKELPAAVKVRKFDPEIEVVETALQLECDSHPNIVKLFKIQTEGASSYVAAELGDCSLKAAISKVAIGGEYDPIVISRAIIGAVQHLHASGFVHGNVTPANVIMFDRTPKLCGFSCARMVDAHVATEMSTILGTQGYQPLEIISKKHMASTEVHNPDAIDIFGVGCTMFFILSGGTEAFRASKRTRRAPASQVGFTVDTDSVELNLLAGESGIELTTICAEGKHLLPSMLHTNPAGRAALDKVLEHPLFWTGDRKLSYLSEIAGKLPKTHKSQHAFIAATEHLVDANLGEYNEAAPDNGGSWSRAFSDAYPPRSGWGTSQRPPAAEEHDYYMLGCRSVGLLNFLRSVYTQRMQHVEALRFPSEQEVCRWLLDPFPFLFMGVYEADEPRVSNNPVGGASPQQQQQPGAAAGVGLSPGADEWHVDDPDPAFGRAVNPLSADANVTTNV